MGFATWVAVLTNCIKIAILIIEYSNGFTINKCGGGAYGHR
jgi:hypothetical protein